MVLAIINAIHLQHHPSFPTLLEGIAGFAASFCFHLLGKQTKRTRKIARTSQAWHKARTWLVIRFGVIPYS